MVLLFEDPDSNLQFGKFMDSSHCVELRNALFLLHYLFLRGCLFPDLVTECLPKVIHLDNSRQPPIQILALHSLLIISALLEMLRQLLSNGGSVVLSQALSLFPL